MAAGITKWLDITPATKDTTLSGAGRRWNSIYGPVQDIKKLNTFLHIPIFNQVNTNPPKPSIIKAQFNFTAPESFTLLDSFSDIINSLNVSGLCCVRYRVGTTVFRKKLFDSFDNSFTYLQQYAGEIIKPNFVLEFWSPSSLLGPPQFVSNLADFYLKTSILSVPSDINSTRNVLESVTGLVPYSDLSVSLPQNLPVNWNTNGQWLTN